MKLLVFVFLLVGSFQTPQQADSLQRTQMAELYFSGDIEGYLEACRELIDYHVSHDNERYIFNAYATLFERLQMLGRNDESIALLEEMSQAAQSRKSALGAAVTEFCFGYYYLENRQPQEAASHYQKAFHELQDLGENSRAIRAGYNLQAIAMNLGMPEEGLAINDSTAVILQRIEEKSGKPSPDNRLKQIRYRLVLLLRSDRTQEALALKDTLLHYAAIVNDPVQEEVVLTAIAQLEQRTGRKADAYSRLDTLIERNLRMGNWLKVARFRLDLANFQRDNGDLELAADNYRAYAVASDSAQIRQTNEQLNALTKKYELNELRLENRAFRQRVTFLTILVVLLLASILAYIFYVNVLRRRESALYKASLKIIRTEEDAEQTLMARSTDPRQSPKEKLFVSLLLLMEKEQIFKDPELDRDKLCLRLGTNRTDLTNAVQQYSGRMLNDFINHFRVRWAAETLSCDNSILITAVGESAGFSSRASFHRAFLREYGMTPLAYRSAAFHH